MKKCNKKKFCSNCKEKKSLDQFYKNKSREDGVTTRCKKCVGEKSKEWREKNPEKSKEQQRKSYKKHRNKRIIELKEYKKKNSEEQKKYNKENRERINAGKRRRYKKNPEKAKEYNKKNKYQINKRNRERAKTDLLFKLKINTKSRVKSFLRLQNISKKNRTFDIVGCSPQFLKEHLEKQFKPGMTWDTYGFYGWHIDHIIPLSSAKTEEEIYKLCHYANLQPLWAQENIKKGSKII